MDFSTAGLVAFFAADFAALPAAFFGAAFCVAFLFVAATETDLSVALILPAGLLFAAAFAGAARFGAAVLLLVAALFLTFVLAGVFTPVFEPVVPAVVLGFCFTAVVLFFAVAPVAFFATALDFADFLMAISGSLLSFYNNSCQCRCMAILRGHRIVLHPDFGNRARYQITSGSAIEKDCLWRRQGIDCAQFLHAWVGLYGSVA